jgi:hypothetical protein
MSNVSAVVFVYEFFLNILNHIYTKYVKCFSSVIHYNGGLFQNICALCTSDISYNLPEDIGRRMIKKFTAFADIAPCVLLTVSTSETSVYFNETKRRYIRESCQLHTRLRKNLGSHRKRNVSKNGSSVIFWYKG